MYYPFLGKNEEKKAAEKKAPTNVVVGFVANVRLGVSSLFYTYSDFGIVGRRPQLIVPS